MPAYLHNIKRSLINASIFIFVFVLAVSAFSPLQPGIHADTGPDLTVTNITISPEEPAIGDTVTITVAVKNQGSTNAFGSYLACHVDSNIIDTKYLDPINAGITVTKSFTWKATDGTHTIKAIADSSAIISETDENNNTKSYSLTTSAADLTITSLTWTPDNPSRGDNVIFTITINNNGSNASQFTTVNFYIDGVSRGTKDVAAIEAGKSVTKTYNWAALSGEHFLKAVIDESNNVKEGNETNNELLRTFATLKPDLVVQKIVWLPENPSKGDSVTFTIVYKNQGSGRADECMINFFIDELPQSTKTITAIEANATSNISYAWTATTDAHEAKAVIDCYQGVSESNESNNEYSVSLTTLRPDLIVKDISWSPVQAAGGDSVTLSIIVANQGSGKAEPSRTICYINGAVAGYIDYPAINAGEQSTKTLVWIAENGSNAVSATADDGDKIIESQESNNRFSTTIPVITPDLLITEISYSPLNPQIGEIVTFTVIVYNQGGGKAQNFNIANYLDDDLLSIENVSSLAHDTTANITTHWTSKNGIHTFKAIADSSNYVKENNEENNQRTISIAPNMPDLVISNTTWSPAELPIGQEITFDISIKNQGTIAADPSRVTFYIDNTSVGYTDIGRLEADSIDTEHLTWTATEGQHTLKIVVDTDNRVTEANENNNNRTVNLPPPDLVVQDITFSPPDVEVGETVTISTTIKNQGNSQSPGSTITYYVDNFIIDTQILPEINAGATVSKTLSWVAKAGMHTIKITADTNNEVSEANETNNDKETVFSTMTPDLVIQDISWEAGSTLASDEVTIKVTIKNQGTGPATKSQVKYIIDQNPAVFTDIPAISADDVAEFSFVKFLTKGMHTANFTADAKGVVTEISESNNNKVFSFSTIAPDLVLKTLTWTPLNAAVGENIAFNVNVENRGRDNAIPTRIAFCVDNVTIEYANIPALNIGAITSITFKWKSMVGPHEIRIIADVDGQITESDEANNIKTRTLTFSAPSTTSNKALKLQSSSSTDEGLISKWWWIVLVIAVLLGGTALFTAIRAIRKK